MKKIVIGILVSFTLIIAFTLTVKAQSSRLDRNDEQAIVTLNEDEVVDKDYFAAGEIVEIYGTVNGDVYAAGGQVTIDGVINGDLLVAGGQVTIGGVITQDVRVAGGNLTVNADVGRNLTLVGGNIEVLDSTQVAGNFVSGAGNINLNAPIAGDVTAGVGNLVVGNSVGGDILAGVGVLRLTSKASVGGNLTYYSDEEALIDDGAEVTGDITKKDPVVTDFEQREFDKSGFNKAWEGIKSTGRILSFTSALIVGLLLIKLYPNFVKKLPKTLVAKPWRSLGYGFLASFGVPIVAIFIMITIIGIPIGLILMAGYLIYIYLAKIVIALWAGQFLSAKIQKKLSINWAFTLGLVAYSVITILPIVGGLTKAFTLFFGLGVLIITCRETYNEARKKNIV